MCYMTGAFSRVTTLRAPGFAESARGCPTRKREHAQGGLRVPTQSKGSGRLAGRYASALFELADEGGAVDAVASDLDTLAAMIGASPDLSRLIRSPVISRDEQQRAMTALLEASAMHELTRRFVGVLCSNRRVFVLPGIIGAFRNILSRQRGETAAEVVSAKVLSDAQKKALADALKMAVGTDVAISDRVDPDILGGLIVKVGSRMMDSSLRTKLQRLRLAMKGV